jgi:hypothetical protein
MTIPELMYGATRYNVHGYLGDDFSLTCSRGKNRVTLGAAFAAMAIRNTALSAIWFLLFILLFGLLVTGIPSLRFWSALKTSWAMGAAVVTGMLKTGFSRERFKSAAHENRDDYPT